MIKQRQYDVIIIGAGPAGACAAAQLARAGKQVLVVERQQFPRFSIGESLLPHAMQFLAQAGMLDAINAAAERCAFQFKDGAAFHNGEQYTTFDFSEKTSAGPSHTYQVKREQFDLILAEQAQQAGAELHYQHSVEAIEPLSQGHRLGIRDSAQQLIQVDARFVLDASGFGRVLPKLLDLEAPSEFPVRKAIFCHVRCEQMAAPFNRNKIVIAVHPQQRDMWFWLIPFADGTASLGVVGEPRFSDDYADAADALWQLVSEQPYLRDFVAREQVIRAEQSLTGYSANVKQLAGDGYALLGNAGEFLDPVFSSGVTIALRSACQAVPLVLRELAGESVDWQQQYSVPLRRGIETFRHFVEGWYDGRFQDVVFYEPQQARIKAMICSILAGYAWDENNPYTQDSGRRLTVLSELCQS
ncbi:NAD(P)/FAD-dependent oxidoreductase [Idiomarina xiamenensis]|uniref:FAD-binding protein n=1 Tax=Idiomarina xiamenensis 10-D-4 TaxID=740709 RepID=K2K6X4_9GAMM|nr:FAD-dependent oxidoreductase [Idiomarina xiamenensis]EKE83423.1 FAD-binding protein [Idiomarina xiamenensis 10-D-4]